MRRGVWSGLACGTALGSALASIVVTAGGAPAAAQTAQAAPQQLPPVTIVEPAPQRRASRRPPPRRQAAPARPRPVQQVATPASAEPVRRERANGPVDGYLATRSATATKTDTPILETPQAISVVPKDQIVAQQAQNLTEALRYTPGVSIDSFGANVLFDWIKIRGFNAPTYLDGLRVPSDASAFAVPRIEPYGLERIEVLKGPSSGLYGQSEPGGLLNLVSKRPQDRPHFEAVGTLGSFDRLQGAFDIGGPVDQHGQFLYRIVGLARDSDTQTDFVQDNKLFIAPSFTWRPTADTSFTVLSHFQRIHNKGYQQYVPGEATLLPNPFGRIPRSRYLGEPGHDSLKLEQAAIGYAFEHRFNEHLQFRQNLRYMTVETDLQALRGDFMRDPVTFLPSFDTLIRSPIYTLAKARNFTVDNQLQADFLTGPLAHKLLVGLDYQSTRSSNETRAPISPLLTPQFYLPINVFNPVYGMPVPPREMLPAYLDIDTRQVQTGVYVQDQIKWDRWTLSLTGRHDWSTTENASAGFYPPAGRTARDDAAFTGRAGLSYLFDFGLAPYVSYSTSFVPNVGVDLTGNSFKPTTGEGKEIGIKFMPAGTNLMFTAALFDIVQDDILTADPANFLLNTQTDQARVRGFELEARGNITRELEIIGGFAKLDPRITRSVIAGNVGNYMPNVNLEQASLWAKYTWFSGPLAGFGLGAGARYVGENYGDTANTIYIPEHTLFDAAISYDFAYLRRELKGWKAQVNVTNIADTYYVASCQGALAYCGLGNGRTVLGTLKYSWN
jgi:iron complex outermembrane recepter protein